METLSAQASSSSKTSIWTGRVISTLCILFLLVDAVMKVFNAAPSVEGSVQLGWPEDQVQTLGLILLVPTILYIFPRTAILGALLLTAYLGGATAIMIRAGQPFFFPIVFGILVWIPLYLRDERLKNLLK